MQRDRGRIKLSNGVGVLGNARDITDQRVTMARTEVGQAPLQATGVHRGAERLHDEKRDNVLTPEAGHLQVISNLASSDYARDPLASRDRDLLLDQTLIRLLHLIIPRTRSNGHQTRWNQNIHRSFPYQDRTPSRHQSIKTSSLDPEACQFRRHHLQISKGFGRHHRHLHREDQGSSLQISSLQVTHILRFRILRRLIPQLFRTPAVFRSFRIPLITSDFHEASI